MSSVLPGRKHYLSGGRWPLQHETDASKQIDMQNWGTEALDDEQEGQPRLTNTKNP